MAWHRGRDIHWRSTQVRKRVPLSSSVGERKIMNHFVEQTKSAKVPPVSTVTRYFAIVNVRSSIRATLHVALPKG